MRLSALTIGYMESPFSMTYPAQLDQVRSMLGDVEYTRTRLTQAGLSNVDVTREENSEGVVILRSAVTLPPSQMPEAARSFVKDGVDAVIIEEIVPSGDGFTVATRLDLKGLPFSTDVHADSTFAEENGKTHRNVKTVCVVQLPFLGKKVEKALMGNFSRLLKKEEAIASQWCKEHF